eukprot:3385230-Alexandrium_andersonii.AAC.1
MHHPSLTLAIGAQARVRFSQPDVWQLSQSLRTAHIRRPQLFPSSPSSIQHRPPRAVITAEIMPHTCRWCHEWSYWRRIPGCGTIGCKWYDWFAEKLQNRMLAERAARDQAACVPALTEMGDAWAEEEEEEDLSLIHI